MSVDKKVTMGVAVITGILWGVSATLYLLAGNQLLASLAGTFALLGTGILGAIVAHFLDQFLLQKEKGGEI